MPYVIYKCREIADELGMVFLDMPIKGGAYARPSARVVHPLYPHEWPSFPIRNPNIEQRALNTFICDTLVREGVSKVEIDACMLGDNLDAYRDAVAPVLKRDFTEFHLYIQRTIERFDTEGEGLDFEEFKRLNDLCVRAGISYTDYIRCNESSIGVLVAPVYTRLPIQDAFEVVTALLAHKGVGAVSHATPV
jgi:hypothetical protein